MDRGACQATYSPRDCNKSDMTEGLSTHKRDLELKKLISTHD